MTRHPHRLSSVFILLLATVSPGALRAANPAELHPRVALEHVTIVDLEGGRLIPNRTIVIEDGRISSIENAATFEAPVRTDERDLPGRFVIPGFVEMHAHVLALPWDAEGRLKSRWDRAATLRILRLLLAHGITTARDPGDPTEAAVLLRSLLERRQIVGPRLLVAGRILNDSTFEPEPFVRVTNEREVRDEVRWQAKAGVDFIKLYAGMPPRLVRAAIEEAHTQGLRVIGHLQATTWAEAAPMGIDALTHAAPWSRDLLPESARKDYREDLFGRVYWLENVDLDAPAATRLADTLARTRIAVDPTLVAMWTKFRGDDPSVTKSPALALAPRVFAEGWPKASFTAAWTPEQYRRAQAAWPKLEEFVRLLFSHGVLLTVGTDTPTPWIVPGASFHQELRLLAAAGIPPGEVLRMATANGAEALGISRESGAVRTGMRGDLVVLRANPLQDLGNAAKIELVLKDGIVYEPRALLEE